MFDQILINLERGKAGYRSTLRSVDGELRKIVSQDPSQLAAARAIQATYGDDLEGCDLAAAEQPAAREMTAPKSARKTAGSRKK